METSIVTTKGQIVIPSKIRRKYSIKEGTKVHFIENGDSIILQPVTADYYRKIRGSLKGSDLTTALLEERKADREKE